MDLLGSEVQSLLYWHGAAHSVMRGTQAPGQEVTLACSSASFGQELPRLLSLPLPLGLSSLSLSSGLSELAKCTLSCFGQGPGITRWLRKWGHGGVGIPSS